VIRYWPEFRSHGKEATLVRWILEHRSGVLAPDRVLSPDEVADWNAVCTALAESPPVWKPGTSYGYHALSFGWLVGELIRRVDGRGPARFIAEEIAEPASAEFLLGLPPEAADRLLDVAPVPPKGIAPQHDGDYDIPLPEALIKDLLAYRRAEYDDHAITWM
jgi:CubicO group peptidase (beta-lactamase class C family)